MTKKSNDGEILKLWLNHRRWSPLDLARELGMSKQNVYNYLTKESISDVFKVKLKAAGYDVFDNLESNSSMLSEPSSQYERSNAKIIDLEKVMHVPLVNKYAYAGYTRGYGDAEYIDKLPTVPFPVDRDHKGHYMAFEVSGDSMDIDARRSFRSGDIVLGREIGRQHWRDKLHINKWSFVIVHKFDGILIKDIIRHDVSMGIITLHSLNPYYDDYDVSLDDVAQIYNVIKVITDL